MLAAATVETSATPMLPPSSWNVLTTPDATPASSGGTFASVVVVAVTNTGPIPNAASTNPGSTATITPSMAGTWVSTAAPSAVSNNPPPAAPASATGP